MPSTCVFRNSASYYPSDLLFIQSGGKNAGREPLGGGEGKRGVSIVDWTLAAVTLNVRYSRSIRSNR
ncbi:hypothetical protein OBV_33540 [Oscillibacter valericigenes Sjm18-20]|nr:hypothetical protein OBV_33540 [Oscillibacter valericigenes Sjm18-20]